MIRRQPSKAGRWPGLVLGLVLAAPWPLAAQEPAWRPVATPAYDASLTPAERIVATRSCSERLLPGSGDCAPSGPMIALASLRVDEPTSDRFGAWPAAKEPNYLIGSLIPAADIGLTAVNSLVGYQKQSFHVNYEGYFGKDTRDGGADKASHFVDYYIVSKEFAFLYEKLGFSEDAARWWGFGVAVTGGLVNEVADGFTKHGFSWEDLLMDNLGAGSAAVISATRSEDLIGFRTSHLPGPTYSHDVYSADLKLDGLFRRLKINLGPFKYLLFSVTYGVKGYRDNGDPDARERQVGFEIGLNFQKILNDLDVRRDTWWGYALHVVGDNVRFPYTAFGFRYDLNHHKWSGPNTGNY